MRDPPSVGHNRPYSHRILFHRWVGVIFLVLVCGFLLALVGLGDPYLWPFIGLGRETVGALGCRSLICVPFDFAMGFVYMYVVAVVAGAAVRHVR